MSRSKLLQLFLAGLAFGACYYAVRVVAAIDRCERFDLCDGAPTWQRDGIRELKAAGRCDLIPRAAACKDGGP